MLSKEIISCHCNSTGLLFWRYAVLTFCLWISDRFMDVFLCRAKVSGTTLPTSDVCQHTEYVEFKASVTLVEYRTALLLS